MEILTFDSNQHYSTLCAWWNKHGHPIVPSQSLSPYGVAIKIDNELTCMSFLYAMDKCDMCQISWTTTNPEINLRKRYESVDLAIDALIILARKLNKSKIVTFSSSKGLEKILMRKGMLKNPEHTLLIGGL